MLRTLLMPRAGAPRLRRRLAAGAFAATFCLLAAGAGAAVIETGELVLRADGGFEPSALPRKTFAPIDFKGHVDIAKKSGGAPPALQQAVLEFDRNGRLSVRGLPTCTPEQVQSATPEEARRICRRAIVGTGNLAVSIQLPGQPATQASSPLTLFNGPRVGGEPTVILHAQTTTPAPQTVAIVVPVERRHGLFGYRATIDIPPIAGGFGALTHVDAKIGRRYSFGSRSLSYVSARCPGGILQTRGRFTFASGMIIEGTVMKPCTAR